MHSAGTDHPECRFVAGPVALWLLEVDLAGEMTVGGIFVDLDGVEAAHSGLIGPIMSA